MSSEGVGRAPPGGWECRGASEVSIEPPSEPADHSDSTLDPEVDFLPRSFWGFSGAARTVRLDPTEHFALSFLAVSAGKGHSEMSPQTLSCNCVGVNV